MEPGIDPQAESRIIARERLRLLAIAYYISGSIGAVMVSMLIFHLIFFTTFSFVSSSTSFGMPSPKNSLVLKSGQNSSSSTPSLNEPLAAEQFPAVIFRVFAFVIGAVILAGWILGGLTIYAGRCLSRRKNKALIYVMAAINCIFIPFGTVLGIVTFVLMASSSAQQLFADPGPPVPAGGSV